MKLLSVEMARVGAIVRLDEVLPLNGMYPPTVAQAIAERYSFVYQPNWAAPLSELQDKGGMEFRAGKFQGRNGEVIVQDLIVAAFGVIANTYSTDTSQELLFDLFDWADKQYETRFSEADIKYFFLSQLMVQFNESLDSLVRNFESISRSVAKAINSTYEKDYPVELASIGFDFDRTSAQEEIRQLSSFAIERQASKPYSSNSFFSQAPLSTRDHIALLEGIEQELGNERR